MSFYMLVVSMEMGGSSHLQIFFVSAGGNYPINLKGNSICVIDTKHSQTKRVTL